MTQNQIKVRDFSYLTTQLKTAILVGEHQLTLGKCKYSFGDGTQIYIYRNKLSHIQVPVAHTFTVGNEPYVFQGNSIVHFHENGVVSEGTLTNGNTVQFTEDGVLKH